VEVQVVDSNRPFATSRSSGRTSALRYAPLAAPKVILAAPDDDRYDQELAEGQPAERECGRDAHRRRELAGHRIWIPGIVAGTEWAAYYDELAAAFGLTIDATGPNFGVEPLLDVVADSPDLATFVGEQTRLVWPAHFDLRRIAVHDPAPVYPHSLIWRSDNPHPALAAFRSYLGSVPASRRLAGTWTPEWARP
jgi:hypothetical protein